jgi:hypothetical protein
MELKPERTTLYIERIQAYIDSQLWAPAFELLQYAASSLDQPFVLNNLSVDVSQGIDAVFEKMKHEWMQGNIHSTRKLLAEYLTLRPKDTQALELKAVIADLDREFIAECSASQDGETRLVDMSSRRRSVVAHVKSKEMEKGIGILEGMIETYPESQAAIREQIGDIRMMQKDFTSANWNYAKAFELNPMKGELQTKINRASRFT